MNNIWIWGLYQLRQVISVFCSPNLFTQLHFWKLCPALFLLQNWRLQQKLDKEFEEICATVQCRKIWYPTWNIFSVCLESERRLDDWGLAFLDQQTSWVVHFSMPSDNHYRNVTYLGRYLMRPRPPIGETRIKSYDGHQVTFEYFDHHQKTKAAFNNPRIRLH